MISGNAVAGLLKPIKSNGMPQTIYIHVSEFCITCILFLVQKRVRAMEWNSFLSLFLAASTCVVKSQGMFIIDSKCLSDTTVLRLLTSIRVPELARGHVRGPFTMIFQ